MTPHQWNATPSFFFHPVHHNPEQRRRFSTQALTKQKKKYSPPVCFKFVIWISENWENVVDRKKRNTQSLRYSCSLLVWQQFIFRKVHLIWQGGTDCRQKSLHGVTIHAVENVCRWMTSDHPVRWKAGYDHNMATIHTKLKKRIKTLWKSVTKAFAAD